MEPVGAFFPEELGWLNRMFSGEESDFMVNVHGHNELGDTFNYGSSSTFQPINEDNMNVDGWIESSFLSSHTVGSNYFSEETFSSPAENHFATDINHLYGSFNIPESMNFCSIDSGNNIAFPHFPENFMEEEIANEKVGNADSQLATFADAGKEMLLKRKLDSPQSFVGEAEQNDLPKAPKKKPRVARKAQKGKKKAVLKKNQKVNENVVDEEETNTVTNVQSSSNYGSDNDSNEGATADSKVPTILHSNGKTRASRGSATDPQSLYARKRRDRINERLRILQNIVPNGTKVDISTMLEEAAQYVKFLQLQIKLLSSDEMWMYAPIAYNGMDMGLYQKISQRVI